MPNSSGPNSLAKIRVKKIIDMIVKIEVIVVKTISFKKGLNLILRKFTISILKL